jgi:hypothetical protein
MVLSKHDEERAKKRGEEMAKERHRRSVDVQSTHKGYDSNPQ